MICSTSRRTIGAEPRATSPELEEHVRACAACADYRREMRVLDDNILRALALEPAALRSDGAARAHVRAVPSSTELVRSRRFLTGSRRWALAASVVLAIVAALVLWSAFPRTSLASDVVAHVVMEPWSLKSTASVPRQELAAVLRRAGLQLDPLEGEITFAHSCWFRGRWVPHFAVRTEQGLVTVLVLPDEHVRNVERFSQGGFSGVLLPAPQGSIAVLGRNGLDPQKPAQQVLRALHPQPHA
jgi:hypothetical protein